MPNYTIDPNTGIKIPTVGVDPGTDYATNVSESLTKLSSLTHTGAANSDGPQIPTAGLNIDADLSAQSHNLADVKSVRMTNQSVVLAGAGDVNCFYAVGGNAYFNNGSGTPVQLTAGSIVEVIASNTFSLTTKAANFTINASDGYAIYDCNGAGTILVTLPLAGDVPAGRLYFFKDITGHADSNPITIQKTGSDTIDNATSVSIHSQRGCVMVCSDGVSSWQVFKFATNQYGSGDSINYNPGSTVTVASTLTISSTGTETVNGALNIGATGTETVQSGGTLEVASGGSLISDSGSTVNLHTLDISGSVNLQIGSEIIVNNATALAVNTGGTIDVLSGAVEYIHSGGSLTVQSGGTLAFSSGALATCSLTKSKTQSVYQNIMSAGSWSINLVVGYTSTATGNSFYNVISKPINGATLTSVDFVYFIANGAHSPATRLRLGVFRVPRATPSATPDDMQSTAGGLGVQVPTYSVVGTYVNSNMVVDQNNVIDTSTYYYYTRIIEETGSASVAGNVISSLRFNYTVTDVLGAI